MLASLFGVVCESEIFTGFGNTATITVVFVLVLIISYSLTMSGAVGFVATIIAPLSDRPFLHTAMLSALAAFLSMFMHDVGALALLMPTVM